MLNKNNTAVANHQSERTGSQERHPPDNLILEIFCTFILDIVRIGLTRGYAKPVALKAILRAKARGQKVQGMSELMQKSRRVRLWQGRDS